MSLKLRQIETGMRLRQVCSLNLRCSPAFIFFCSGLNRYPRRLYNTPPKLKYNNKFTVIVCLQGTFINITKKNHNRFIREL